MANRFIPALLMALLVVIHAQLWFGRGSVPQVNALRLDLSRVEVANKAAQHRNEQVASEVDDLREGLYTVEELARQDFGMVKPNEIFVQFANGLR
ncbi:FtsB family cell division protein [Hydrogenophaga electricum]|uniref:Cell division protein FtsB n=1 Tax=Hydrogenophaga electricum TaxID=1230953 RepID=A0ABQ6C4M8_9BURK|nr:septum formation initiator family protein [Hydrogenophaga electricum]GLS14900.1 cell division protein FtsB [Hydrogenophaga electricum]